MSVKRTERGWAGHFICGHYCRFRRNTLLENDSRGIVVSTVGAMFTKDRLETVGAFGRYYETMAFEAKSEPPYTEANVNEQLSFDSPWSICAEHPDELSPGVDNDADAMHEAVVMELTAKLEKEST